MNSQLAIRILSLALLATMILAVGCDPSVKDDDGGNGSPTEAPPVDELAEACSQGNIIKDIEKIPGLKNQIDTGKFKVDFDANSKTLFLGGVVLAKKNFLTLLNNQINRFLKKGCVETVVFHAMPAEESGSSSTVGPAESAGSSEESKAAKAQGGGLRWMCPYECDGVCQLTPCDEAPPAPTPSPTLTPTPTPSP